MKKSIFLPAALIIAATAVNAQKLYLDAGFGYAMNGSGFLSYEQTQTSSGESYKVRNFNLGTGMNFGLLAGYKINNNLAIESGIGYRMHKSDWKDVYFNDNGTSTTTTDNTDKESFKMLQIPLALRLTVGEEKMKWYSRFGLNIGVAPKYVNDETNVSTTTMTGTPGGSTTSTTNTVTEYTGGSSMGMIAGFGMIYHFNEKMGASFELNANVQGYSPGRSVITKSTTDGQDNLANMTVSQKETEFVDEYSMTYGATPVTSSPSTALRYNYPISTWGFRLGFHMLLGAKE